MQGDRCALRWATREADDDSETRRTSGDLDAGSQLIAAVAV